MLRLPYFYTVSALERCQRGRMCLIRNQVYRKVPGVRIPPSPLNTARNRTQYSVHLHEKRVSCRFTYFFDLSFVKKFIFISPLVFFM